MSQMKTRSGLRSKGASDEDGELEFSSSSDFALLLIEALKDEQVQECLSKAFKPNEEKIAQLVTSHLQVKFSAMQNKIDAQNKRIETLEKTVPELQQKQDDAEQYSRRTSVRIAGIPESNDEDVMALTKDVLEAVNLSSAIINRVHRVGPKPTSSGPHSRPRAILCQFLSYGDKAALIKRKKQLKTQMTNVRQ